MPTEPDARLLIHRRDLARTRRIADPDRPGARPLADGEARLAIAQFALTANNITYAAFGEAMKYWQFFPAPAGEGPDWACLPVWGFATVTESRAEGLAPGRRVWGYFPAGSHLVVQPTRAGTSGFVDRAAHRQELAAVYNHYAFCDADPAWSPDTEGLQAVLKPLFTTAYLLDDFLFEQGFFGARQLLLSSASSKTAYATAFCLAQRRGRAGAPDAVGLTSPAHRDFAVSLACYDRVALYDEVAALDPSVPSLYVDFAGHAGLRRAVHEHFGTALTYSASIGGTHWTALGGGGGLPGPRPVLFFAPAQAKKRSAPPPDGWGTAGLQQRLAATWAAFLVRVQQPADPWLHIVTHHGGQAVEAAYHALLEGRADPRQGVLLVP